MNTNTRYTSLLKRITLFFPALILLCMPLLTISLAPAPVAAAEQVGIRVFLEEQQLSFTVPPQVISGRVMVPMRPIFEAMGATLEWDQTTQTATAIKDSTIVVTQIGNNVAMINGVARTLDVPATAIDGNTLAPLCFVAEAFGDYVKWDGASQTAYISATEFPAEEAVPVTGDSIKRLSVP